MAEQAKSGPPTPRFSSPSALPSSSSPNDIKDTGATTVSPGPSLGAGTRRNPLSSGGRGGSTSSQPLPQAPASYASEISDATSALREVTLGDSRFVEGHSDGMICSIAMNLQLIKTGHVSRPQGAQKNSAPTTNLASNPLPSKAPHKPWQGPTQEILFPQGAAARPPQGNPTYQYSSPSGSQNTGNAQGDSKKGSSVGDETVDTNLSGEVIRGTDGEMEPLDHSELDIQVLEKH